MHTCMHAYIHACIHTCMNAYKQTDIQTYMQKGVVRMPAVVRAYADVHRMPAYAVSANSLFAGLCARQSGYCPRSPGSDVPCPTSDGHELVCHKACSSSNAIRDAPAAKAFHKYIRTCK